MKKNLFFSLFALATMLFTASCQEEDLAGGAQGNTATATFEVSTPMIATRAVGDGTTAKKLYVAVYEKHGTELDGPLAVSLIDEGETVSFTERVATVNLQLAKNKDYTIIFWAETEDNNDAIFDIDWETRQLTLKDELKANQESYDAFWKSIDVKLTGALTDKVELTRPFAQLNIGTSDKAAAKDAGIVVEQTKVVVTNVPNTFDLVSGDATGDATVTYDMAAMAGIEGETFPAGTGQSYLSLNYLLMGDKQNTDVTFSYKDAEDAPYVLNFTSVPVQRNYRTNIYGTLLTNSANYTVEIKPGFGNEGDQDAANIVYVTTQEEFEAALKGNDENIVINLNPTERKAAATRAAGEATVYTINVNADNVTYYLGGENTDSITINANGCTINFNHTNGDWNTVYCANKEAKLIINDAHLTNSGKNNGPWNRHDISFGTPVQLNNVTSDKAIALLNDGKLTKVSISDVHPDNGEAYGLWISPRGQVVELDGCEIIAHSSKTGDRGITINDQYTYEKLGDITLTVKNTKFDTQKKAAILVKSNARADIYLENVDLSKVAADGFNAVWVDKGRNNIEDVTVTGGFVIVEDAAAEETNPFLVEGNTVNVAKGVYTALPKVANGVTIIAEEGTVFTGTSSVTGENVTIKNVTFKGEDRALTSSLKGTKFENCHFDATYGARYCYAYGDVVFTDCTFGSEDCVRGVHFDDGDGSVTFNGCTLYGFQALGAGVEKMTFNDCVFAKNNNYNVVNMYSVYEFNRCQFNPEMNTDCTINGVVASFNGCSYTDGKSIYSLVRFDKEPATCTITFDGKQMVYASAQLASAVKNMEGTEVTLLLAKGTVVLPASITSGKGGKVTIEGIGNESVLQFNETAGTADGGVNCYADGMDLVFKNLKVVSPNTGSAYTGGFGRTNSVTFENCTYEGQYRAVSANTQFIGCTIDPKTSYIYTDYANADFSGCTFNCSEGKGIQVYNDGSVTNTTINVTNCTFTAAKVGYTWDKKPVAAIDINSNGEKFTVNITNTTATGFGTGLFSNSQLWNIKGGEANVTVNVDGSMTYPFYLMDNDGAYVLKTVAGMQWFANQVNVSKNAFSGKTVKLGADIDLAGIDWEPIGQTGATTFNGVFDGQNYTIYNLSVDSEAETGAHYSSGLFGWVESHTQGNGHLKNVKINGATIKGHHNCGALVGYITQETALVENCHVTGATVSCTKANSDADGDKAGALIGNATVATPVKDCTAASSTISAGRDAGQVIGAGKEANVTGCSATDVTVSANGTGTGANIRNEVIGRLL